MSGEEKPPQDGRDWEVSDEIRRELRVGDRVFIRQVDPLDTGEKALAEVVALEHPGEEIQDQWLRL